jgi:hypothetical protein
MPFKDPERRKEYQREYMARYRGGGRKPSSARNPPRDLCIRTANDCLSILENQVLEVLADDSLKSTERARTIGYLAGICLKAVEVSDLEARLARLEADTIEVRDAKAIGQGS